MVEELELATLAEFRSLPAPELVKHVRQAQRGGTAEQQASMVTLIRRNIRLIRREARRFFYRASPSFTTDDIEQTALVAFTQAVRGFQTQRGVCFSTYVTVTLRREVKRACENSAGGIRVSVNRQRQLGVMRQGESQLMAVLGRSPTEAEVGQATGFSAQQLKRLSRLPRVAFSLDDEDEPHERRLPVTELDDERELDVEPHLRAAVVKFLQEALPTPLYEVTRQYFGFDLAARSGRTSAEIAARLHLDENQVKTMLWKARRILRLPENARQLAQILNFGSGACPPRAF
jgi:RNA polymerase sigma factor (sigma-70 family)